MPQCTLFYHFILMPDNFTHQVESASTQCMIIIGAFHVNNTLINAYFKYILVSDRSPSPKGGRHTVDDPFAIPGYREARDRYRDEHSDSDRPADSPYGRPHDEVPAKKLRPDYDFAPLSRDPIPPPIGKPVEAPIDCEIIIINKQQMYV